MPVPSHTSVESPVSILITKIMLVAINILFVVFTTAAPGVPHAGNPTVKQNNTVFTD